MYKATVKHVATGKNDSSALYCESKSGNVYKFRTAVPADRAPTIIAKIESAKVINTKHWIKVKEGEFKAKPAKVSEAQLTEAPSDAALDEMEIQASIDTANERSIAAKKGWATRRANAQQVAS